MQSSCLRLHSCSTTLSPPPSFRAACLGSTPPNPSLTIHGPGWTTTIIPVRTTGTITFLGLTLDLDHLQTTQTQGTKAYLTQASTILSYQRVTDTAALVASISTMDKAAYTAQFIPWSSQDLLAVDVPLNRAFRSLLQLPPTHPNGLLYMRTSDGGLGLPSLSDQVKLKARSASGMRGDNIDDWPCLADPGDLALLTSHVGQLQNLPTTSPALRALLTAALSGDDWTPGQPTLSGTALLSLGDPRLPYSLF